MQVVERAHHLLEIEWNKLSNNHRKYLTDVEKDDVLNIAVFDYVELFAHGNNPKELDLGFEVTEQRIDMLHTLVRSYPESSVIEPDSNTDGIYVFNLPEDYRAYVTSSLIVSDCSDEFKVIREQHVDLNTVLRDYHRKPSKVFREAVGTVRNDKLYIYTNEEFTPTGLKLTYIKNPTEFCLGTYLEQQTADNPQPQIKPRSNCDLPEEYLRLVITIAKQNLDRIYGNINEHQLQDFKIKTIS